MRRFVTSALLGILVSLSALSHAALEWNIQNVLVKDVSRFKKILNGTAYYVIQVSLDATLSTGCAPTDTHGIVSVYTTGDFNNNWQMVYASLLAAQAQQIPIDIQVNASDCNTYAGWDDLGAPHGLGLIFEGVRVHRE